MSCRVLVIPEDPTLNGHILKPLVKVLMADAGRPSARVRILENPRVQGYVQALQVIRDPLPNRYRSSRCTSSRCSAKGRNPRPDKWTARVAQHPKLADFPHQVGMRPIPRYACKMAAGSGKTVVMAMIIAWAFCNRGVTPGDPRC